MTCRWATVLVGCGLLAARLGAGERKPDSKKVALVTISYATKPTMSLPRGLNALAVLDAGTTDDAEKKWSQMAANMISGLLDDAARRGGSELKIVDRANIKKIMKEKDLALAGLVDGAQGAEASKLLGVQGLIASSIMVKVEKHTGKGRTLNIKPRTIRERIKRLRRGRPVGVPMKEVRKVTRNITVQCTFRLVDAGNAKIVIDHVSPMLSKTDRTRTKRFWGSDKTEADLTPRDYIIGELVEHEVRRFIGRFLPVQVAETIEVHRGKTEACKAGVRFLAAGEYDEAIRMFSQAIAESKKGKDKYARFGMGVACEAKGQLAESLDHYRKAVRLDAPGAEQAVKRVRARMAAAGAR